MFDYDATNTLPFINVPTLILAGNKDILCKPEASEYMAAKIPGAQLRILKPCGHMGPLERNEEMNAAVEQFALKMQFV